MLLDHNLYTPRCELGEMLNIHSIKKYVNLHIYRYRKVITGLI